MRNGTFNVYKVDDGFVGKAKEVSQHLQTPLTDMLNLIWSGKKVNGHTVIKLYNYRPIYGVFEDDKLIMKGSHKDIAKKLFLAESTVRNAKSTGRKLLGIYEIKELEGEYKWEEKLN